MRTKIFLPLLLFFVVNEGCMTVDLSVNGITKPVLMNTERIKKYTIVKHLSNDFESYFTLFDLITVKNPEITKYLNKELETSNGDACINLKISGQTTVVDKVVPIVAGLIGTIAIPNGGFIVFYMIGMRTYTVEADIIRYLDSEEPVKITPPITIDPMTGLPLKKDEKKSNFDPETGLPKKE